MPFPSEHAARLHEPAGYDRFRRENDKFGSGVHAIWGVKDNKAELQAIRFDASKFTVDEARAWLKEHDYHPMLFEPASGTEDMTNPSLCKYAFNTVTASADDNNLPSCTITTINTDREGDRVIPEGGDFSAFMKSPVLMWAHGGPDRYAAIPIGTVTALEVQPGQGVKASWKWLENDPFADRIRNAWDQGVVRASSIGFKPVQATPNGRGMDHERWELIELSLCAVPMNPEAVRALKGLGLLDEPATLFGPDGNPITKIVEPVVVKDDESVVVEKRGRVLSAVNESRLRAALTALSEVLSQLMPMADEDEDEDHPKPKPMMSMDEAASDEAIQFMFDEPTVLRLTLDDSDEPILTLVDDEGHEPVFVIDPELIRSVIADAVKGEFQHSLIDPVGRMVQQALDQACGRVH